jgi:hypothetical protein
LPSSMSSSSSSSDGGSAAATFFFLDMAHPPAHRKAASTPNAQATATVLDTNGVQMVGGGFEFEVPLGEMFFSSTFDFRERDGRRLSRHNSHAVPHLVCTLVRSDY